MNGYQEVEGNQNDAQTQNAEAHTGIEKGKTKQCTKCKRILPTDKFCSKFDNRDNKIYIAARCNECNNKDARERREKDPEKYRRRKREYIRTHPEIHKKEKQKSYLRNKEKVLELSKNGRQKIHGKRNATRCLEGQ